jgi:putative transcriptional regulator
MSSLAGSFLVARRSLQDANFRRSVVLLLHHDAGGAFGLVVNRPALSKGLPFPLFTGGPCEPQGLLILHGHPEWAEASPDRPAQEVAPGVFVGDASWVSGAGATPPGPSLRYRLYLGYAGWGPGQLEGELAAGAWAVATASGELLFDTPVEDLWESLVPPELPQPSRN